MAAVRSGITPGHRGNAMEISRYTYEFAIKNKIRLEVHQNDVLFWELDNHTEPIFIYSNTEDGLFLVINGYFNSDEELPHYIQDEKKLRNLIRFVNSSL